MAIDVAKLRAYAAAWNRQATFEGLVEDLEQICRREWPRAEIEPATATLEELVDHAERARPGRYSRPWFAQEILLGIAAARHQQRSGHGDAAMAEALTVGVLVASAMARHPGPWLAKWVAFCEKQAGRSRAGITAKRDNAARTQDQFRAAVDAARRQHPTDSTRRIAHRLLPRYGRSGDRAKAIDALAKRISRL